MLKTKTWILIFTAVFLLSAGACLLLFLHSPVHSAVEILQDGVCVKTIDLSDVKEPYTLVLSDKNGGSNTILVEPGRIRVLQADCPDQVCVRMGWLADSAAPIVCLPHRLVIRFTDGSGLDSVSR